MATESAPTRPRRACRGKVDDESGLLLGDMMMRRAIQALHHGHSVIFTGSGISANAGLSTFSSASTGVYAKAAKKYGLKNGQELFRYTFLQEHPQECFQFLQKLLIAATKAKPTLTHRTLRQLECDNDKLLRHYTLNIDGLAAEAGLSTWDGDSNPDGKTVELHGTLRELLCLDCHHVLSAITVVAKAGECSKCGGANMRFRVLTYDDQDLQVVPGNADNCLRQDIRRAMAIFWIGISFEQSATCELFGKVWQVLSEMKDNRTVCFIVDPNVDEVIQSLTTAVAGFSGKSDRIHGVSATCDELFQRYIEMQKGT